MHSRSFRMAVVPLALASTTITAQSARPSPRENTSAVEAWIDQIAAVGATPGFGVAVVRGDSILIARGYGIADVSTDQPVSDSTRWYIASSTKALTALATSVLHYRTVVSLDATLASLLPDLRLNPKLSPRDITLRDLLALRHGIGDGPVTVRTAFTGEYTAPQLMGLLAEHAPASTGRAFRYANIGFNVAGLALERRLKRPWQEIVEQNVLLPLGMRSTTTRVSTLPPYRIAMPHALVQGKMVRIPMGKTDRTMHAAGGHFTTPHDIALFLVAQLNDGRVVGERGVDPRAIAETHRVAVTQDRTPSFVHRTGWGLGWDLGEYDGIPMIQRNGGFAGYYSHLSFMPEQRIGVAVFANGGMDADAAEMVAQGVYDLLLGRKDLAALAVRRDSLSAAFERTKSLGAGLPPQLPLPRPVLVYLGEYVNEAIGTLVLEGNGDHLMARIGDSWGVVRGLAGPDKQLLSEVLVAAILGDDRRFRVQFDANGHAEKIAIANFVFARREKR